jgi:hypothetical protein
MKSTAESPGEGNFRGSIESIDSIPPSADGMGARVLTAATVEKRRGWVQMHKNRAIVQVHKVARSCYD